MQCAIFELTLEKARRNKIEAAEKADAQLAIVIAVREKIEAMIAVEQNNAGEKSLADAKGKEEKKTIKQKKTQNCRNS